MQMKNQTIKKWNTLTMINTAAIWCVCEKELEFRIRERCSWRAILDAASVKGSGVVMELSRLLFWVIRWIFCLYFPNFSGQTLNATKGAFVDPPTPSKFSTANRSCPHELTKVEKWEPAFRMAVTALHN